MWKTKIHKSYSYKKNERYLLISEQCVDVDCKKDVEDKEYTPYIAPYIIAGACVAVVILIIVIVICCVKKRRRSSNTKTYKTPTNTQVLLNII